MTIAVDFDGTIVEHDYPRIGKEKPFALETLRMLMADGHKLILWTARDGERLQEAVEFCRRGGVEFYAINSNTPQSGLSFGSNGLSSKVTADVYIDDRNIGGIPDWGTIYEIIAGKRAEKRERYRRKKSLRERLRKLFR